MFRIDTLNIDLLALQEDSFEATFILRDENFQSLEGAEIKSGDVCSEVTLKRVDAAEFSLLLRIAGKVDVPCDRCLDDMAQPVKADATYSVKLGQEARVDEDVIVVDEKDGVLPIAWLIYETIALAIPIKHVHAPGKCNAAMTQKLEELSATRSGDEEAGDNMDPRWAELDKLKK